HNRTWNVRQPYSPCEPDISTWPRQRPKATFNRRHVCQIQIHGGQLDSSGRCRREDTAVAIPPPPGADGFSPDKRLCSDFQAEPRPTSGQTPHHLSFLAKRHSIDLTQS